MCSQAAANKWNVVVFFPISRVLLVLLVLPGPLVLMARRYRLFIYFHPVVGELKHYNVNSQTSGCQLIRLLCFLQGETGPAGPSGAPGTRGTPVCVSVIVHYQRR